MDHLLLPCFSLFLSFSTTKFMQIESWRAIPNLQNNTGPFQLWSFPSKAHARMHSDTLTGRRQESMLRLTSMANGLVHWVWGSTTKSSELSWPDLPYLSSSYSIWPTKRATQKQSKWTQSNPLSLAWALIEVGATWCTLRVYLTMY